MQWAVFLDSQHCEASFVSKSFKQISNKGGAQKNLQRLASCMGILHRIFWRLTCLACKGKNSSVRLSDSSSSLWFRYPYAIISFLSVQALKTESYQSYGGLQAPSSCGISWSNNKKKTTAPTQKGTLSKNFWPQLPMRSSATWHADLHQYSCH
jgi:hypothetical protein